MADYLYNTPTVAQLATQITGSINIDPNLPENITPLDVDLLNSNLTLPPIDYSNLDFSSIKLQLLNLLRANAPSFGYSLRDFSDSNTAGMFLNLTAYMGQMLSFHMDSIVNELFLDTAQTPWATFKLLNMYGYKPTRPQSGVILLAITRRPSTNYDPDTSAMENSSEVLLSNSLSRKKLVFGNESFELFASKSVNGTLVPDMLGDVVIPAYKAYDGEEDPDFNLAELQNNTYFCFGLTGTTIVEDFISNGSPGQSLQLGTPLVNDSKITVQVEDTSITTITGKTAYTVWDELTYLSLAGFRSATTVQTTNADIPYLISSFKLSPELYALKKNSLLQLGTVLIVDYSNTLQIANYREFENLKVFYQTCLLSNLTSSKYVDDKYVDVLIYHPAYAYGSTPEDLTYNHARSVLTNYVITDNNEKVYWSTNEILYLLDSSVSIYIRTLVNGKPVDKVYYQPQLVSESQIALASSAYADIVRLRNNPNLRVAVGRALSENTLAFGISAESSTYLEGDTVYEVTWDGNFKCTVRFGDGVFGKIPPKGAAIKVIYRANDSQTSGNVVRVGEANQLASVGSVNFVIRNEYESAPATSGEDSKSAKQLVTRFFSSQDRAVIGSDYTILTKKFNSKYKVSTTLVKSDSDAAIVRLYTLVLRSGSYSERLDELNMIEKLQLKNYLDGYKCMGVSLEIVDGLVRPLDVRIDIQVKPGYIAGQVKTDATSVASSFFSLSNAEMGLGFRSTDLIKAISAIPGIATSDFYFGGLETLSTSDGAILLGNKMYQQIKDIRSFSDSSLPFPAIGNSISSLAEITQQVKPYEILVLDTLTINIASS